MQCGSAHSVSCQQKLLAVRFTEFSPLAKMPPSLPAQVTLLCAQRPHSCNWAQCDLCHPFLQACAAKLRSSPNSGRSRRWAEGEDTAARAHEVQRSSLKTTLRRSALSYPFARSSVVILQCFL
jgi:hypothetical protein